MWAPLRLGRQLACNAVNQRNQFRPIDTQSRSYMNGLFNRLGVVGVPFGKGQKVEGPKTVGLMQAPDVLRTTGFMQELQCFGIDVLDYGNVSYAPLCDISMENMCNLSHVAPCTQQLSQMVSKILCDHRTCLTLGGDHSIAIGSINAHLNVAGPKDVAVLYVDAHADINLCSTTGSGNIHGMTLALLAQELVPSWPECIPGLDWLQPCLALKNIAYIGLRSVDPWERYFIEKYGIPAYSMEEVEKCGIYDVVQMALKQIDPCCNKSIHLSFDIDSLDYSEAPCTTLPVRGGLTLREGLAIAEGIYKTRRLGVMDLVEVNPLLGNDFQKQVTLDAAKHILLTTFGHSRKGNLPESK